MMRRISRSNNNNALAAATRGTVRASFEARYHGSVPCSEPKGNAVCMDAVSRIHALKLKPQAVNIVITDKGIYVDDRNTKELIKKVPLNNLSWVCTDPRNKHLFSFIYHESRTNKMDCYTFSLKKNGKVFVKACNAAIADMVAEGSRAEAEAMLIAASTPIMPVVYEEADPTRDQGGELYTDVAGEEEEEQGRIFADADAWVDASYLDSAIGCFKAVYRGGIPVKDIEGFRVVQQAAARVKDFGMDAKEVTLVVTEAQVLMVERDTGDHLQESPIKHVSYSLLDPRDNTHFYYIVNDPKLGFGYCHVLRLITGFDAIATCFAAAHRCVARERERAIREGKVITQPRGRRRKEVHKPPIGVHELKYLGAVRVKDAVGNQVASRAMLDLKTKFQHVLKLGEEDDWTAVGDRIVLVMTTEGVRVVELATGDVLHFTYIRDIAFSTHLHSGYDRKHNPEHDIFAYIARDEKLSRTVCHLFKCPPGAAREICKTAAFAFKICMEEMQRAEADNPFNATTKSELDISDLFPPHLLISRRDIKAIKVLGAGQFGTVWLALQRIRKGTKVSQKHRAVKLLRPGASELDQEDFLAEAITMSKLDHPNLVSLVGVSVNHMPWLVVLEFMRYGDVKNVLVAAREKGIKLTYGEQLNLMLQLTSGMTYLASKRLVHMDLAARNCLLHTTNILKIGDFGLTKPFDEGKEYYKLKPNMTVKLPAKWMAVECLNQLIFSEASDVWACGVTMWEIATYGMPPYQQFKNKEMRRILKQGTRLEQPSNFGCPDELYQVMLTCWTAEAKDRCSFRDLRGRLHKLLQAEQARTNNPEFRDIGLMVNDGVAKELPTQRETVVEMYSSFTPGTGGGNYFDVDGADGDGRGKATGADGSYFQVGGDDDSKGSSAQRGGDGAYLQIANEDDDESYMQIEAAMRNGENFGDVSRRNPLFQDADYFDVDSSGIPLDQDAYFDVQGGDGADDDEEEEDSYLAVCRDLGKLGNPDA
ncbi:TK/HMTK protein kinase [Salpingoeca rosetta]|uniref:TK/HMTK protein kinase n=1 Tax=Salpingoeca rosetta (strain ATCC 50818 / BSB-021) TaxID=946362 RepID=F2UHB3_SALR5|nr:TK/HMTK protein kinase [Salpingoeca rosetta]EGD76512.1 TK/HMTK protein kinase [Salpingoeca rosetta]|eukprot:XP_004991426.1 TK/HMTK protein kinase [Salpingoeca rosetta]